MGIQDQSFDAKDPAEIIPLVFDFSGLTPTPVSPVIVISHEAGAADPTPAALLLGSPQVVGAQIRQKIQGGVLNADYRIRCQVDTPEGLRWVKSGVLPVRAR